MSTQSDCAKAIRTELRLAFPKTKFSVRSERASMMTAVDIRWADGPKTADVDAIIGKYEYGHFDGMTDCYHASNLRSDIPQAKYVNTHRSCSCCDQLRAELEKLTPNTSPYELGGLAHQLLEKTDLTSGYVGVRRTKVTCGQHREFYEIVTGNSPAETPDVCQLCDQPTPLSNLEQIPVGQSGAWLALACPACREQERQKKIDAQEAAERETQRQTEAAQIMPLLIDVLDDQPRLTAQFARLNKNETLRQYQQEIASGRFDTETVEVTHVVRLSPLGYRYFCEQLMTDFDWLAGLGGTNSDYSSKYGDDHIALGNDKDELHRWRKQAYRLGVLVTDGERCLIADPQGYNYARYVGLYLTGDKLTELMSKPKGTAVCP